MMSEKARLEAQTLRAQSELAAALAELRGSIQPAVDLVEKGANAASAGLESGAKLLGAVSSAGGSVAGTAQAVVQKISDVAAPLSSTPMGEKAGQVATQAASAGAAGLAVWGLKKLLSSSDTPDEKVPEGALPAVLNALLPRKTSDLQDAGGAWLAEADDLRKEADRELSRIERALARGKGDPDDLIAHRDEILETLTKGLKIAFSRGLDQLDAGTRRHVLQKRGEEYAAHLAQLEAEAGGGGLTGMLRRHPMVAGGAVLVAGAAAAWLLPRGTVAAVAAKAGPAVVKAAPVLGSLAKDAAIGAVSRTGILGTVAGFALKKLTERREEEPAEAAPQAEPGLERLLQQPPVAIVPQTPLFPADQAAGLRGSEADTPQRAPLVLDQYGAALNRG